MRAEGEARLLRESFTFPLEQAVSRLGALELRLHDAQGLPCWEDGFTILPRMVSTNMLRIAFVMGWMDQQQHVLLRQTLLETSDEDEVRR
jgi:hypothetical protein